MNKKYSKIAIATFSWAKTNSEKQTVLKTLRALNNLGYPLVVTDQTNSRYPLIKELMKLDNTHIYKGGSLDEKVNKSFNKAAKLADYIFYTESDKLDFAKLHAKRFINHYLKNLRGTLVPSRTKESFSKYPKYQQEMERFLWLTSAYLFDSKAIDISYGPRIFPAILTKYLKNINGQLGFGFQTYLLAINYRLGLPLWDLKFGIIPPKDVQKGDELKFLRMSQVQGYLEGLMQGWKVKL